MVTTARMNEEELEGWILRTLGAPIVKVQLTKCHLEDSIADAKRWFTAKKGQVREMFLPAFPGGQDITLPDDVETVLDLTFEEHGHEFSVSAYPGMLLPEQDVPVSAIYNASSGGFYSGFVQVAQHIEMARRVMSAEPDWVQEGRILRLFSVPPEGTKVHLRYKSCEFATDQLTERDLDLVRRYALVKAKERLRLIRGVYEGGFQASQGSTTFNLSILETDAEMEKLEQEIAASSMPMGIFVG